MKLLMYDNKPGWISNTTNVKNMFNYSVCIKSVQCLLIPRLHFCLLFDFSPSY